MYQKNNMCLAIYQYQIIAFREKESIPIYARFGSTNKNYIFNKTVACMAMRWKYTVL